MASCASPVIDCGVFRCITCVEIQLYYMFSRYMYNTHFLHM